MVVVNHFKSKGSAGPFPGDTDQGDGQGAGNVSRVKQATALARWIPTVQGGVDDVLLLGDFNSYTEEDPMHVLYDDGYIDLEKESGNEEYSYSFSGPVRVAGPRARQRLGAATVRPARTSGTSTAVESVAMEYSRCNYHATDFHDRVPYRSSDHDPLIVGIDLFMNPSSVEATVANTTYGTAPKIDVTVTSDPTATGRVQIRENGRLLGSGLLNNGVASIKLGRFALKPGAHTLTVNYLGDATVAASTTTVTINVAKVTTTVSASVTPAKIVAKLTKAKISVVVGANGVKATGKVRITSRVRAPGR